ncbi:MAG: hypothetical protein KOO62_00120 [candidate division Zixibacteria bacterium]|nr:hypothetical protein [candidate division Zixibacteria bacterium]
MPKRITDRKYASLGEKDCWHPYSLQMLRPSRFTTVVGKILSGRYLMVSARISRGLQNPQ